MERGTSEKFHKFTSLIEKYGEMNGNRKTLRHQHLISLRTARAGDLEYLQVFAPSDKAFEDFQTCSPAADAYIEYLLSGPASPDDENERRRYTQTVQRFLDYHTVAGDISHRVVFKLEASDVYDEKSVSIIDGASAMFYNGAVHGVDKILLKDVPKL